MPRSKFHSQRALSRAAITLGAVAALGSVGLSTNLYAQLAPATPVPIPAVATPAPTTPDAEPILLIYRAASAPFGQRDTVSALVFGDHSNAKVHLRLIASDGRATDASSVIRGSDGDTEPLWPQWISPAIMLDFRGWKQIDLPASSFTYRPPVGETAADAPKLSSVDAFGIDMNDVGETLQLDSLTWSSGTNAAPPLVVDDFESGDFAAWQKHGTPETTQDAQLALVSGASRSPGGRVAFSVSFADAKLARTQATALLKKTLASTGQGYIAYVPASPFRRILPTSLPQPGETSQPIVLFASPDQTESGSFCIYSEEGLPDVTVAPLVGLQALGHVIDKSAIDIRVVKVWNREGTGKYRDPDATGPTPELLMKDDRQSLVMTNGAPPQVRLVGDAETTVPAHTTKQFWVTVHVPKDTKPGHYSTQLSIECPGTRAGNVTLSVEVLPLQLYSPAKQYVMGLTSRFAPDAAQPSAGQVVDKETFAAQLDDIHDHGFLYATLSNAPSSLWDAYSIYKTASLGATLMYTGLTGSSDADMASADQIAGQTRAQGISGVDFILPDDAPPMEFAALHKAFKTTGAFIRTQGRLDALGDSLDMPIYAVDEPYVQQLLRTDGQRTSSKYDYWFWPAYENDPQANRLYAGYLLYRANLYGAYLPDYQNDVDGDPFSETASADASAAEARLNPQMLTYPVQGGVLDTIQWESVAAGVNDMRYLTTFFAALRECKDNHVGSADVALYGPQVKTIMDKAFWVLDDTEYQKARRVIAHDAIVLRMSLNKFYNRGGANPLSYVEPAAATRYKPKKGAG